MLWPAMAPPPGGEGEGGFPWAMVQMFLFVLIFMWFFMIRPQRKKQKEHTKLLEELKKGDKVVTSGGMFGVIFAIDDERGRIVLKIGDDVKMEFLRSSIAARVDK